MRPRTTLFLLSSVDGKISTGASDRFDFDQDLPKVSHVCDGLHQYYDLEQQTDLVSWNTGRVMAKIGTNDKLLDNVNAIPVTFVILDNLPHLTQSGIKYLLFKCAKLIIVTSNSHHPASPLVASESKLAILSYPDQVDFIDCFQRLYQEHQVQSMTIQSGGKMNAELLRLNLIDNISVVMAPLLVGGKNTPTMVDGDEDSLTQLASIHSLKLKQVQQLESSYIHLIYEVIPNNL